MRYRRQQGLAMVEFTLVLPLLLLLMFAAAEFGRALFQYNTLLKAVRDGARYMAQNAFLGDGAQKNPDAPTEAMNLVVYGSIAAKTCNPNDAYPAPCDDLPGFDAPNGKADTHLEIIGPTLVDGSYYVTVRTKTGGNQYLYRPVLGNVLPLTSIGMQIPLQASITMRVLSP